MYLAGFAKPEHLKNFALSHMAVVRLHLKRLGFIIFSLCIHSCSDVFGFFSSIYLKFCILDALGLLAEWRFRILQNKTIWQKKKNGNIWSLYLKSNFRNELSIYILKFGLTFLTVLPLPVLGTLTSVRAVSIKTATIM